MKPLTLPRFRPWSQRKVLATVGGVLCSLAVLITVDGLGVMRGAMLAGVTTASTSSMVIFQQLSDCRTLAAKALTPGNPDGARLSQGLAVPGRSQDDPLGLQFTRDKGLNIAACMVQTAPSSLLGNLLVAQALETSFIVRPGVPALSREDQALRQRLLEQVKTANEKAFRQASMDRAALKHQVRAMCSGLLGNVECAPWRLFAAAAIGKDATLADRWLAFRQPETLVDRMDNSESLAASTDVVIGLMEEPQAFAALLDAQAKGDFMPMVQAREDKRTAALALRAREYTRIAQHMPVLDDLERLH